MSYRAFKRLLGETSLERKCRFLLGAGILLLMTLSFWVYARLTENVAYNQTETTGRMLVTGIMDRLHGDTKSRDAIASFQEAFEKTWPEALSEYKYKILKPKDLARKPEHKPEGEEVAILNRFLDEPSKVEETRTLSSQGAFYYLAAIRAEASCVKCYGNTSEEQAAGIKLEERDLMAVVKI